MLQHNGVVSLKGHSWGPLINHSWDAGPGRVTRTTKRLSHLELSIKGVLGLNCLESRAEVMHQIIHREVHVRYFLLHFVVDFDNLSIGDSMAKNGGQVGEELHLLSLVIKKLSLLFLTTNISELPSDAGVSQANQEDDAHRQR